MPSWIWKSAFFFFLLVGPISLLFLTAEQQLFSGWDLKCPFSIVLSLDLGTGHGKDLPPWRPGQGYEQTVPEDERLQPQHCCSSSVFCLRKLSLAEVCALQRLRVRSVAWTLQHLKFYLDILSALEIPALN